jgi:hypothetical protein
MLVNPPAACLRLLLALLFASATVIGLFMPAAAKNLGHAVEVHQAGGQLRANQHAMSRPHQHETPDCGFNAAIHLKCLGCVIHCLGMATLDEIDGLPQPQPWKGCVMADQHATGAAPACLERPPDCPLS